ncbi:TIM barrel protein [[Clostridium] aminophilum]|uniref:sugar phosphate isomerase/epimerase family protein n=1 Tax=[Clostridium] aminophilum TaxID=1526 RepID=UPI0033342425
MARKYSLAYLTIPGTNPMDQIRIAKEAGYDYVSLRTIPMHLPGEPEFLLDKDPELFEATKKALKEYDMPLMDIELARVRPDLDIEEYEPAFEKAAELGGTDVLGSIWTRDKAFYVEKVGRICEMAKKYGLNYNVEFLPWAGVRNLQEDITLVDTVGADNLFVMVDTLHAGRAGVTPEELKRTPKKYFHFMHLCDGPAGADGDVVLDNIKDDLMLYTAREARYYVGEGDINIAGLVEALPDLPLSIELPNLEAIRKYGVEGHAKNCIDKAKAYFAERGIE